MDTSMRILLDAPLTLQISLEKLGISHSKTTKIVLSKYW